MNHVNVEEVEEQPDAIIGKFLVKSFTALVLFDTGVEECSNFKILLRTRKIMVMHSNERGECCPRTLVDRKRKR